MGSAPKGSTYVELDSGVPLIAGAADYGDVFPRPKKATLEPTKLCKKGDIIICVRATIGDLNWADKEYCLGRGVAGLRVHDEKLDSKYLWYFIASIEDELYRNSTGSTFPQINKKVIESLEIPLPPLETQKQIAAVLEEADQLRKDCQQMEQELNSLAQSVFIDMFGDPVTNPKGWETVPCKTLCEKITVGVVVQPASYYIDSGVPALRSLNVRENKLSEDKMMYFSKEAHTKQLAKSQIFEGDVLIVRSGQPGRAAVVTKKFDNCNCIDVLIARPDASVLESQYLSFFLNSEGGRKLVLKEERGQVQKHLNVKVLNEALIPYPPIEKQRQFIDVYNILLEEMNNTLLLSEYQDALFNALMQKAFNGELNL
ncbi:restriction endonuclease subunit S [Vibrio cyclitrophicus]|uniref:restriction endonuclease subunit S n=1 Tax=Vibrio cyclitrophicus TaxID=47951 RepID=UPI00148D6B13